MKIKFYILIPIFLSLFLSLTACKVKKDRQEDLFFEVTQVEEKDDYKLFTGKSFEKATIIKDTISNNYRQLSKFIAANYIPTEKNLTRIEKNIKKKYFKNRRKYYRQYRGFRTIEKDTIIEVGMLTKYGARKFSNWKSTPYEIIELHKKSGKVQFDGYLYFTASGKFLNPDSLRTKITENIIMY